MGKLQDRVAIVTGGAKGIGQAICARYAAEGAKVVIADIDMAAAEAVAGEIGPAAMALHLDVADQGSIDAMLAAVQAKWGTPQILVNNAAIFDLAPITEITREQWRPVFAVNVEGLFFTLQTVAKAMIADGVRGAIINMSSQAGRRGEALVAHYCASKAAVISLTQSAGLGLIGQGVRVNGIAPGVIDTPMWAEVDALFARYEGRQIGEKKREVGLAVPYGRMGVPADLAGAAVFLASDDAEYIVAQTLNVDGGNWMS
jgi:NAD(P)-dependent dehydrogenase (short-subunit alcohol dehydrogenase family)